MRLFSTPYPYASSIATLLQSATLRWYSQETMRAGKTFLMLFCAEVRVTPILDSTWRPSQASNSRSLSTECGTSRLAQTYQISSLSTDFSAILTIDPSNKIAKSCLNTVASASALNESTSASSRGPASTSSATSIKELSQLSLIQQAAAEAVEPQETMLNVCRVYLRLMGLMV